MHFVFAQRIGNSRAGLELFRSIEVLGRLIPPAAGARSTYPALARLAVDSAAAATGDLAHEREPETDAPFRARLAGERLLEDPFSLGVGYSGGLRSDTISRILLSAGAISTSTGGPPCRRAFSIRCRTRRRSNRWSDS